MLKDSIDLVEKQKNVSKQKKMIVCHTNAQKEIIKIITHD